MGANATAKSKGERKTKITIEELNDLVFQLSQEVFRLGTDNKKLLTKIKHTRELADKTSKTVNEHFDEPSCEIKVMEKDGRWGDFTGAFYNEQDEKIDAVIKKAEDHAKKYFDCFKGKEFALFLKAKGKSSIVKTWLT